LSLLLKAVRGEVVFGDDLDRLLEDFPELYGLVCWRQRGKGKRREYAPSRSTKERTRKYDEPLVERRKWAEFWRLHHLIRLIFSSISSDFR
jgi:hypothetical protein